MRFKAISNVIYNHQTHRLFVVNTLFKTLLVLCLCYCVVGANSRAFAQEQNINEKNTNAKNTKVKKLKPKIIKAPLVIESQVKGSQEQPKVIYITPWQSNDKSISIKVTQQQYLLPSFKPINPKKFREQVSAYHQHQQNSDKQKAAQ